MQEVEQRVIGLTCCTSLRCGQRRDLLLRLALQEAQLQETLQTIDASTTGEVLVLLLRGCW